MRKFPLETKCVKGLLGQVPFPFSGSLKLFTTFEPNPPRPQLT